MGWQTICHLEQRTGVGIVKQVSYTWRQAPEYQALLKRSAELSRLCMSIEQNPKRWMNASPDEMTQWDQWCSERYQVICALMAMDREGWARKEMVA